MDSKDTEKTLKAGDIYIRRATPHDLFAIESLMRRGLAEADSIQAGIMPDYDFLHAAHVTLNMAAAGQIAVAAELVEGGREKIVGTLMLEIRNWHWNPSAKYLESVHFYVATDYRAKSLVSGGSIATGLLDYAKWLSTEINAVLMVPIIFPPERVSAKDALLERSGFTATGGNFIFLPTRDAEQVPAAAE